MLLLLSPAKLLDTSPAPPDTPISHPRFLEQTHPLRKAARALSATQWQQLTGISAPLATLNHARFAAMQLQEDAPGCKQAILSFNGDVYRGLHAASLEANDIQWAQAHVRIISGLYGLLRPLDAIEPYRLEMGTRLKTGAHHTLYDFWGDRLARSLKAEAADRAIINLASNEYIKAVKPKTLPMIDCVFHEIKHGHARPLFMYTKRARGLLCRFAITERIESPDDLRAFNAEGYRFEAEASSDTRFVFTRPQPVSKNMAVSSRSRRPVSADH